VASVYVMGSMRSTRVQEVAKALRERGYDVFDDWISPGPEADDRWQAYEKARGRTYAEALQGYHARHVFALDKKHLDRCDVGVLVLPAGKSAHIELGYLVGQGKTTYVLFDGEPERYDVMYLFATTVFTDLDDLLRAFP
jgi:nucleoside 2-deoxyribosyltransferase